jgi:hypothetical protein
VKAFIEQKTGKWNWNLCRRTTWRWKEKQAYRQAVIDKALQEKAEKDAKALEIPLEELRKAKKAVLWILIQKITSVIKKEDEINVFEQEKILRMIKTELWEPTNITKNDTTLKTEPLDESLFIDD